MRKQDLHNPFLKPNTFANRFEPIHRMILYSLVVNFSARLRLQTYCKYDTRNWCHTTHVDVGQYFGELVLSGSNVQCSTTKTVLSIPSVEFYHTIPRTIFCGVFCKNKETRLSTPSHQTTLQHITRVWYYKCKWLYNYMYT